MSEILATIVIDQTGMFNGKQSRIMRNGQDFFKVQIREWGKWRDITYNCTAISIVGRGNERTQLFSSYKDAGDFVFKYFIQKQIEQTTFDEPKIDENWQEQTTSEGQGSSE